MENFGKRVDVKLVWANEEDKRRHLTASPGLARSTVFNDNLAAIQVHKSQLVLNRPVYVGLTLFDIPRLLMYDLYCNQLNRQCGKCCQLLYTDTDALCLKSRQTTFTRAGPKMHISMRRLTILRTILFTAWHSVNRFLKKGFLLFHYSHLG